MRIGITLAMLFCCSPAVAQSTVVLERVSRAAEVCRSSITASNDGRPHVWSRAIEEQFIQDAPDQAYSWSDGGTSVLLAPGTIYGAPACEVVVSGASLRPTAVISAIGAWARSVGFVAVENPGLLFSMQTDDLYLDARSRPDGLSMEFGWRDH